MQDASAKDILSVIVAVLVFQTLLPTISGNHGQLVLKSMGTAERKVVASKI